MKRFVFALLILGSFAVAPAQAEELARVVLQVDRQAYVEWDGPVYVVVTSALRVTPHDAPYTEIVRALCAERDVLIGVERVVVLNSHAFKGAAFWTFDEHDDLAEACEAIDNGMPAAAFAMVE